MDSRLVFLQSQTLEELITHAKVRGDDTLKQLARQVEQERQAALRDTKTSTSTMTTHGVEGYRHPNFSVKDQK